MDIQIEINQEQANEFCKFCERTYFDIFQNLAKDTEEAYRLRDATYEIWKQIRGSYGE